MKIKKYTEYLISENIKYHIDNNISVTNNIFRVNSDSFYSLLKEVRNLYDNGQLILEGLDKELYDSTDIGKFDYYNGELVPLDIPVFNEDFLKEEAEYKGREVELNKPMRSSGPKKYKVYVKNPKTGKVIVVNFGDAKGGLTAKVSDPKARKAFAARHQCHLKKDKTTAGFWSCRINRYGSLWGGKTYPGYW
jgi:hypothetical protein